MTDSFRKRFAKLPRLATVPIVDIFGSTILLVAVALLDFALQLITLASDHIKVVISKFAPLLLDLSLDLLPVAFNAVPVHVIVLLVAGREKASDVVVFQQDGSGLIAYILSEGALADAVLSQQIGQSTNALLLQQPRLSCRLGAEFLTCKVAGTPIDRADALWLHRAPLPYRIATIDQKYAIEKGNAAP